ncbi:hypothetical protein Cs7R123_63430 [Catellatospora sp. TT07R-123]|uniref:hypothetical protein n=1 Tax=Catellatospora sp. TT07R-123 TaxID=2733863 RepID=UPI001B022E78|nr:hypothetical protein [Catellatospora sp. TT07R-123]GHJ49001.1 hypothetical protein Cs7R123_63430 [Catellatospora sp. TT07R-123]
MAETTELVRTDAELVAETAARLDRLVERLEDEAFATALANNPKETMMAAGLTLDHEGLEAYIRTDPERFETVTDALFQRVDSDFLMAMSVPSCC